MQTSAYNHDLDEFLNSKPQDSHKFSKPGPRPQNFSKPKKTMDFGEIKVKSLQKGILNAEQRKKGLSISNLRRGPEGARSILDVKLPSEILKEGKSNNEQNAPDKEDLRIQKDLEKLDDTNFLSGKIKENGNMSTVYMLKLLKEKGIIKKNKANGIYGNINKKERYDRFLDTEKEKAIGDTDQDFYKKYIDFDHHQINLKDNTLIFDPKRFEELKNPIILEYRDKNGRLLNKKEAFNQGCQHFHGVKPSSAKLNRLMVKRQKIQREKSKHSSTSLPLFYNVAKKITGSSYINLTKDLN